MTRMNFGFACAVLWGASILALTANAQERPSSDVERALQRVQDALENEPGLAPETKDALRDLLNALKDERTAPPPPPPPPAVPPAAPAGAAAGAEDSLQIEDVPVIDRPLRDRVHFYGDLRLRYESQFERDTADNRHRGRVRLRTGINVEVHDQVLVGARLVTGDPEEATSTNQTLDDVFDKFEISLDRIFLKYQPERIPNSWFMAGKFGAPWRTTPIFDGMTWDSDVQPEGVAAGYAFDDVGPFNTIAFTGVQLFVEETSGTEDAFGTVFQVAAEVDLADTLNLETGVTYFSWSDLEIDGSLAFLVPDNNGNVIVDGDFQSDFGVLHPYVVLSYDGWKYPVALVGEYVNNLRANNDRDQGWSLGASLGAAEQRGDWQLFYQWVVLEQDAVLTAVNSDDFTLHSGFRGHHYGLAYQLTDRVQLKPNVYTFYREHPIEAMGQDDDYQWKTRLDLNIRF